MLKTLCAGTLLCFLLTNLEAAPGFQEVNAAFGLPLLQDLSLWDDAPDQVAKRLSLPPESKTTSGASFRLYTPANLRVLGAHPYSIALAAGQEGPTQVSWVFTNSGDFGNLSSIREQLRVAIGKQKTDLKKAERDAETAFPNAFRNDVATVSAALTKLFGPPESAREGTARSVNEKVQRWTWNGHVFQLATKDNQYVTLRMIRDVQTASAKPIKDAQLRQRLKASVERRPNGDVVVGGIPMVDQGPKGFCVAATLDRVLKFVGIPSDMYVLAVAGETKMGGGASPARMMDATADLARSFGCRFEKAGSSLKIPSISRYIDEGLPLIWTMFVVDSLNKSVSDRLPQRQQAPDAKTWKNVLKQWKKQTGRVKPDAEGGHVCMIMGYNKETDELAISDSWGPEYKERWISVEEAEMISGGELYIVSW